MKLEDLKVYQLAMELGEQVWGLVVGWDYFLKSTIGTQLVKAADSVAANISEGFGRYHYKDAKNFYYYARGSLYETKTWLTKAHKRNLIPEDQYQQLMQHIDTLGIKLNNYINVIGKKSPNDQK
jgi:four helix bundle protein